MAKLLKHLGFGSKKGTPQASKSDYGAQKSSSVQELLPSCSPSGDRPTVCLSTTASHAGDFDTASLVSSPARMCTDRTVTHGGARSKELTISPKSSHRYARTAAQDGHAGRSTANGASGMPETDPPVSWRIVQTVHGNQIMTSNDRS